MSFRTPVSGTPPPVENGKPRIVVICGPTAVGKTAAGIEVARAVGGEILSADSMQVYRHMDIGTAKPTVAEQAAVGHHLIDIVDPDAPFDAATYAVLGRRAAAERHRRGVVPEAVVEGTRVLVGNAPLLAAAGIDVSPLAGRAESLAIEGKTAAFVAVGGALAGLIALADTIKPSGRAAVEKLRGNGLRVIMLTGDGERTARAVASTAAIDEVISGVLPGDKAAVVRRLQAEDLRVAMVGDGINDAPALAQADVGIALGTGTDVAMASADITLMADDLAAADAAFELSRRTIRTIQQNLFWAFAYNVVGIPVAAGVLYPFFGVLLDRADHRRFLHGRKLGHLRAVQLCELHGAAGIRADTG